MDRAQADRVWLVTGAAAGPGRAICEAVLGRGERLVATADRVEAIADLERSAPGRAVCLALDVTDAAAVSTAVDTALERLGRIDVLVNAAGRVAAGSAREMSEEATARLFDVTVAGALQMVRAVLPHMRSRGSGHIVQVSSALEVRPDPGHGLRTGSRLALEGVSEALADELGRFGIRVLIVDAGPVHSDVPGRSATLTSALLNAVDSDDPPLRLGLEPAPVAAASLRRRRDGVDVWKHLARAPARPD